MRPPTAGADAVRGPRSASGSPGPARPGAEPTRSPAASPPLAVTRFAGTARAFNSPLADMPSSSFTRGSLTYAVAALRVSAIGFQID